MRWLIALLLCLPVFADSQTRSAGTATEDSLIVGTIQWDSLSNISVNGSYVNATNTEAADDQQTYVLRATNFNFNLPPGASIEGFKFTVRLKYCHEFTTDGTILAILPIKSGSYVLAGNAADGSLADTCAFVEREWGGATDLWDTTWTEADIESSNFGIGMKFRLDDEDYIDVDYVTCTVYFSTATQHTGAIDPQEWWIMFLEQLG